MTIATPTSVSPSFHCQTKNKIRDYILSSPIYLIMKDGNSFGPLSSRNPLGDFI